MRGMFTVDWRDAWRSLRAAPMVTAFAVVSLALGIGGVTALFSILNSLALKPLPVRDPAALAILADNSWTNPIWEAVRDRKQTFAADAFAWATVRFNLSPTAAADMVEGLYASGGMFDMLGVPAVLGRTFTEADDARGGGPDGPVAVISYAMWQRRYGGAPDVDRQDDLDRARAVHDHRRDAEGILRPRRRPLVRRRGAARDRAAGPPGGQRARRAAALVDEHHGAAEARADRRAGDGAAARDPAADPRRPRCRRAARRTCAKAI